MDSDDIKKIIDDGIQRGHFNKICPSCGEDTGSTATTYSFNRLYTVCNHCKTWLLSDMGKDGHFWWFELPKHHTKGMRIGFEE